MKLQSSICIIALLLLNTILFYACGRDNPQNEINNEDNRNFIGPIIHEKKIIILSPHPDDGVLTFGGMLQNNDGFIGQNKFIVIYEPFTMTNFTAHLRDNTYTDKRISHITGRRLMEDYSAYNEIFHGWNNYTFLNKLYPEGELRGYLTNQNNNNFIGQTLDSTKNDIGQYTMSILTNYDIVYFVNIYEDLKKLLNQSDCAVFGPSGSGSIDLAYAHRDHFIVREALIQAIHDLAQSTPLEDICQVYFGEDQPYTNLFFENTTQTLNHFRERLGINDINNTIEYKINNEKKLNLFNRNYPSQLGKPYTTGLLSRDNERIYLWPKNMYLSVNSSVILK